MDQEREIARDRQTEGRPHLLQGLLFQRLRQILGDGDIMHRIGNHAAIECTEKELFVKRSQFGKIDAAPVGRAGGEEGATGEWALRHLSAAPGRVEKRAGADGVAVQTQSALEIDDLVQGLTLANNIAF
jgi:hypothetical protein